jgi:glycosyltransferase involved in cell wall biosynthesis
MGDPVCSSILTSAFIILPFPMRLLHLSTGDAGGGAARAAHRLHTGLRGLGVDSSMLVLRRTSGDPTSRKITFAQDLPTRLKRSWRGRQIRRDFAPYKPTLPPGFELFSDDRTEVGYDLVRNVARRGPWDVINLHWVGGLVDYGLLLHHLPPGVPLVWRLADMGPLTGGCHYDGGCGKFTDRCGACPVLGSHVDDDLSRQVWQRKREALAAIPTDRLTLVGTSRWIAGEARRSSLFGRFPVQVIPNGLDTDAFAPRDRAFSRNLLGVPLDRRVVLFVAEATDIKRKGFDQLAAALGRLDGTPGLFLLSVGEREPQLPNAPNLPRKHLGRLNDDRLLSVAYSAADVFVIPSLQESFGQTVTEAMACGTPVVGFDVGGIPDMVRPGVTGELVPVGDDAALAEAIRQLLADPDRARRLGEGGRRVAVEEYGLPLQASRYLELYRTVLGRPAAA